MGIRRICTVLGLSALFLAAGLVSSSPAQASLLDDVVSTVHASIQDGLGRI